ncbi:hypothetical protein HDU90_004529 [Geranomyces variabilis]|nr:hypothetical protein HDU90_004529 [Geranomyces variabilis]
MPVNHTFDAALISLSSGAAYASASPNRAQSGAVKPKTHNNDTSSSAASTASAKIQNGNQVIGGLPLHHKLI